MDIGGWLRRLGLEQYEAAFRENKIDDTVLPSLTAEDLKDLGVGFVGHRRKLLDAIAVLRAEACEPVPLSDDNLATEKAAKDTAERRQVTVMFADLVGSTELSARMDPEDLREVISAYQRCVADTMRRFDGFVAKYMGDGALVYFGYPRAHEDEAERAVQAGLDLIAKVAALELRVQLQTRIGIATGLVVVGDLIGGGETQERGIVGETPNIAARLQGIARPDTVVIAESTRRLVGNLFEFQELGPRDLKGVASPVLAWVALAAKPVESRFDALHPTGMTALVGRAEEIELLTRRWVAAKAGEGQVVLISGEAGIGKSRLTAALMERIAGEPHTRLRYFCSPHHQDSALHPNIAQIERAAGFRRDDTDDQRLDKLEALLAQGTDQISEAGWLIANLLSVPTGDRYPALDLTPQRRKQRTIETLLSQVGGLAARHAVFIVFEDVHWSDPTTLEVLDLLIDRLQKLRVLLVITFRPEFVSHWIGRPHVTLLSLTRLLPRQQADVIMHITGGKPLPKDITNQIVERTDGVPLFIEELTKTVIESGLLANAGDHYATIRPIGSFAVPTSLQASLLARLDRLTPTREVAQMAAALGRQFSYDLISAVADMAEPQLNAALAQLVQAELVFQRGAPPDSEYTFKHALVQDTAYGTLLRSRRQQLHSRIAAALENKFPDICENQPDVLSRHCTEAGWVDKAIGYLLKAGRQASERSAMNEAAAQLRKGIELAQLLPEDSRRHRRELDLQTALGTALTAAQGYAASETGEAYARARMLCEQLKNTAVFPRVAYGQWLYHIIRGEVQASLEVAEEILAFADATDSTEARVLGHRVLGVSLFEIGQFSASRKNLDLAIGLIESLGHAIEVPARGRDARIMIPTWMVMIASWQGRLDQARSARERALAEANASAIHSRLFAQCFGVHLLITERQYLQASEEADSICNLATDLDFPYFFACGSMLKGVANAYLGDPNGLRELREGINLYRSTGAKWGLPYWLWYYAIAPGQCKQVAASTLDEAVAVLNETGERWMEAELYRLRGDLWLSNGSQSKAEADYQLAIQIACEQGAMLHELRSSVSLAQLWRGANKHAQAHNLLSSVFERFTEGFDSPDLVEARELLDTP